MLHYGMKTSSLTTIPTNILVLSYILHNHHLSSYYALLFSNLPGTVSFGLVVVPSFRDLGFRGVPYLTVQIMEGT